MPSIISKILHRKKRSSSTSSNESQRNRRNSSSQSRNSFDNHSEPVPAAQSAETPRQAEAEPVRSHQTINPVRSAPPPPTEGTVVIPPEENAQVRPEEGVIDTNRDLPSLPRSDTTASREIKDVESRRQRTLMDNTENRQSVEGEVGRESASDTVPAVQGETKTEDISSIDRTTRQPIVMTGGPVPVASLEEPRAEEFETEEAGTGTAYHTPGDVITTRGDGLEGQMAGLNLNNKDNRGAGLEEQRVEMADRLLEEARMQKLAQEPLSEEGRKVFEKGGLGDRLDKESTVDVKTKWMKPVIHETVHNKIHTEYTTVIEQHIHKHHVFPKIQFIEDPNPAILPTRHRIFSPKTGKWHEVIGDDAAIEILGEDVFHNGPKEHRHVRRPYDEFEGSAAGSGGRSGPLASLTSGMTEEEMLAEGLGTGKGKVVEREGVMGGEMGEWKPADRGEIFGQKREEVGVAV